jgi:hypothetical protein
MIDYTQAMLNDWQAINHLNFAHSLTELSLRIFMKLLLKQHCLSAFMLVIGTHTIFPTHSALIQNGLPLNLQRRKA